MTTNKDCRNAKTAEEYLLQCLFKAEDDRDKAIAYCDEVRAKEDEHKAYIESLGNLPVYEYDREICSALADLIDTTCDFLPESYAVWYDENDNECSDYTIEDPYNHENAYCSKCGGIMMVGEDGEDGWFTRKKVEHGNKLIPNFDYCPYCRCRVRK